MPISDIGLIMRWWGTLFLFGAVGFPLARRLFSSWYDQGYLFAKAIALALTGWIVLILAMAHVAPFGVISIAIGLVIVFVVGLLASGGQSQHKPIGKQLLVFFGEEIFFLLALFGWAWVKAHEPSIHGLEKFMDYGFMNSILQSAYFPPMDMWYPPLSINYYYFGHLVTAILTKISGLDLAYTFNLMLCTIFAWCFTMSFSIGAQLALWRERVGKLRVYISGLLTAFLVTLAGNMQTIYAFTRGYVGDEVKPFWELTWGVDEFVGSFTQGWNTYWYANATRFIPYSIHEFPSYSFVVSDVHGHVLSIPFVLLAIALLFSLYKKQNSTYEWWSVGFYGFLAGVLLMTNALDGPIYAGLFIVLFLVHTTIFSVNERLQWKKLWPIGLLVGVASITSLPFLAHFKSFVNGIAVNCPPEFLANSKIGILLFEGLEKCQESPFWMLWILWGFFWFCGTWLFARNMHPGQGWKTIWNTKFTHIERTLSVFFVFSTLLVLFSEFFYFKDIYPMHFRSNTMFKLGYQAFIMFAIVAGVSIMQILSEKKSRARLIFFILLIPQFILVSIYPYFAIRSYFGELRRYEAVYGLNWLGIAHADSYRSILWLREYDAQHPRSDGARSVLVEADGDSYTDYNYFSVFAGMPTPIGWAVHEWLWRGSYDAVSPRREQVRAIYESEDVEETERLLNLYNVRYIIVGEMERQKFTNLVESKFSSLATPISVIGDTIIFERGKPLP